MRSLLPRMLVRFGAGALLLLLSQVLCAPRTALAGCDHLAGSGLSAYASLARLDDLITGQPAAGQGAVPGHPGPKRPLPCSGPSCSGRVPLPVSTVLLTLDGLEQWGLLADSLDGSGPSVRSGWIAEPPSRPSRVPSCVFHPPRSLA